MRKIFVCAGREITRHKGRALGNAFGFSLAIGIMVVLGHLFLFSDAAMKEIMSGTGTHFMAFVPAKPEDATNPAPVIEDAQVGIKVALDLSYEGFLANTVPTRVISKEKLDELLKFPELIKDASPYLLFRMREGTTGNVFSVGGFDPANKQAVGSTCCAKGDVISGEFITPQDTGVVMLEQGFAETKGLTTGASISVGGETFRVKGIVNPGVRPAKADVYIPFVEAEKLISKRLRTPLQNEMNVILVEVANALRQNEAIEKVKELLKAGIVTSYACYQPASKVLGINQKTLILLEIVFVISVVLLSMKSQYASIVERRRDFGILKSIGWANHLIFRQVVAESAFQAVAGGVIGCMAGIAAISTLPLGTMIKPDFTPYISAQIIGIGLLVSLLSGMIAGLVPAFSAVHLKPAETLRQL
ncbi:MAG: macrolide transporter ATP-binding /permease protein [bacterium ADurb.Bin374]|nr:MAG: macrolide transporter ATP-binding /permease protein [bacterium ADurb.Bin374]